MKIHKSESTDQQTYKVKKQGSCPDFVSNLLNNNNESEDVINDIMQTKFKPEIIADDEDFQ